MVRFVGDSLKLVWCTFIGLFRSRASLEAEILMLRHQLNVLQRKAPKRPVFGNSDRPQREPERRTRGLDTMLVEPPTDWSLVIRQALLGERSFLTEAFGEALGEYGNDVIAEVETMIT